MNSPTTAADEWSFPAVDKKSLGIGSTILGVLYFVLCIASLVPFISVPYPPIVDFANHAARLNLACNVRDPFVQAMYEYKLGVIPNLAVDLANLPACQLLDGATVLKIVTSL